ncbi:MAG: 50S ribosomal protein L30 [Solirubrobacterales bacterium]
MGEVLLKQVRSANGASPQQRDTLRTLKLGRIGKSSTRTDNEHLQGLLRKVEHLVTVEPASSGSGKDS